MRHGDAMRVADWRTASGLDVIAHVLFDAGGLRRDTLRSLMEARRFLLASAAALAAERRTEEQAEELRALAARRRARADRRLHVLRRPRRGARATSSSRLILNSVRPVYFEHAAFFAGLVTPDQAALYARAAEAVADRDAAAAHAAVTELAERQERALEEALG